jgi:hypothetical protein
MVFSLKDETGLGFGAILKLKIVLAVAIFFSQQ